ncbi:MAG: HNH endonuclease [Chloroflexaceae bacterium]|nr:HNH endonuclease [Chloroflexaceae bacterium]
MSPGVPDAVRQRVREQARDRCGYCQGKQQYVFAPLEIDHIIPTARGGTDEEDNLWLACPMCNSFKGIQAQALDPLSGQYARLFNPRHQQWSRHFQWSEDGTQIIGRTVTGRATVVALQLNNILAVVVRAAWVSAGANPPKDQG